MNGRVPLAEGELVADEGGESSISMADYAIAFVDELENSEAAHTQLGIGY